ncbi:TetR/AcrR family transcriptional regulator [Aliagarivorans taiwanensis]|uniref:TetR/AcrR family transcriptional regulator n=1 Tax=Aliagarivorans taiwanensis TaxID=561966 RepID=UPI0004119078|nr:TetR/AcrR family transcriptional regulator [Aliagarivorans taiwanensis]
MNVNVKKRGRPSREGTALKPEKIIDTAKQLMVEQGKIPSIRQLATALQVDAMAIYHYFKSKAVLLEAVTTSLISDIYQPVVSVENGAEVATEWQTELRQLCLSYLNLLEQYPGLLETLLSMESEGPAEVFAQRFSIIVEPLELDPQVVESALALLVDYLHGFALAMNCNRDRDALNSQMIEGPLGLYCKAFGC